MKKTAVLVLALVLVVSLSLVAFVACNDNEQPQKASNSEVLGTTVAVLASNAVGASSAAEDNADATFKAGVNIQVGDNNELKLGAKLTAKGVGAIVNTALQKTIDSISNVIGKDGVKVEKDNSITPGDIFTEKYAITLTYVDEKTGKETTRELALYLQLSEGAELEGKEKFDFTAKVTLVSKSTDEGTENKETTIMSIKGNAEFDKDKNAMVFTLGASAGDKDTANAFANVKAYATANGAVKIEMGAGADIVEGLNANVGLSVEIGKLADNKYGAIVSAQGKADASALAALIAGESVSPELKLASVDFAASLNVYANSEKNASEFAIKGNVEINVSIPFVGSYKGTAAVNGKAVFTTDDDSAVIGLDGTINFQKVENENNK